MKTIVYLLIGSLLTLPAFAGKLEVPAVVKTAFAKNFPNAKGVKWEKENGHFEAEFTLDKKEYAALFDTLGTLLETETEVAPGEIPGAAWEYTRLHFPGKKLKETSRITDANGLITFEIEVAGKDLIFDSTGNFLKEKIENED